MEIEKRIKELEALLPPQVDPSLKSSKMSTAVKIAALKGCLAHRLHNLSSEAYSLIQNSNFIPAMIMIRAAFETSALIFNIHKKMDQFINDKDKVKIEKFLERIILGSRNSDTEVSAYNILNALDEMSKEHDHTRLFYDDLSEFSHPNYAGVLASYSYLNESKDTLLFGPSPHSDVSMAHPPLSAALLLGVVYIKKINDIEKTFYQLSS